MYILAHRGLWHRDDQKNTMTSFITAFDKGFGVELDARDLLGKVVISHDPPLHSDLHTLNEVVAARNAYSHTLPIAINVKSDGLPLIMPEGVLTSLRQSDFFFDMSIPETLSYYKRALPYYSRISDVERHPLLLDHAKGILVDGFDVDFGNFSRLKHDPWRALHFCVISAEIHGRECHRQWQALSTFLVDNPEMIRRISLCTDIPDKAREFFVVHSH